MTAAGELPALLARAASILDASGLIIWIGAGEQLFAVTAHGYDPRVIDRLGPIGRNADNATAASWRSGEVKVVPGDLMSNGAVVAPMFSPDACIGVLAAEVRHGREDDAETCAVTSMIAAQLATVVSAWPAASASAGETPPVDRGDRFVETLGPCPPAATAEALLRRSNSRLPLSGHGSRSTRRATLDRQDARGSVISSGTITLTVISFLSRKTRMSSTEPGFALRTARVTSSTL